MAFPRPPETPIEFLHPSQLYSSLDAFVIFLLAVLYSRMTFKRRIHGEVFWLTLILYAMGRFFMESTRNDTGPVFGTGMTIAQVVSVTALVPLVPVFAWILVRRYRGEGEPADAAVARPEVAGEGPGNKDDKN